MLELDAKGRKKVKSTEQIHASCPYAKHTDV